MRRRTFGTLVTAGLLVGGTVPAAAPETVKIRLKHVLPSEFARMVVNPKFVTVDAQPPGAHTSLLPAGIESLAPDDPEKQLIVRGDEKAVAELRGIVGLVDIAPRPVKLGVRLLRYRADHHDAAGRLLPETVLETEAGSFNNQPALILFHAENRAGTASLQPRVNGDDSVTLFADVRLRAGAGGGATEANALTLYRRVLSGNSVLIPALGDAPRASGGDGSVTAALLPDEKNTLPKDALSGKRTAYFLEVTPGVTPRQASR